LDETMGMHFGVVVSDVDSTRLINALDALAPRFSDRGPLASVEDLDMSGEELAVGDADGRSCLLDGAYMLSSDADLLSRVAVSTGGLVIGAGAETVSGTFYLVVARGDQLIRHYFQCDSDLARPYSVGEPVAGESGAALDDIDGAGLSAVLAAHGFDYDRWRARGPKRKVTWTADHLAHGGPTPWAGPADAALERHRSAHQLAPGTEPPITVQVRVAPAPPKKPWWRFW
jgi:hypothetical protein